MSPLARRLVAVGTLLLALAVVAVLTLRAMGVPIALGPLASPTPLPLPTATPGPSPDGTPTLEDELAAIEAAVADLRDLPPAGIGPAEFVTRDQLVERLAARFEEDYPPDQAAADTVLLRALGLLTADQDVAALRLQLLGGQVIGWYDDQARQMTIVTDAGLTNQARVTYAHEYAHALQDAAFGLDSLDLEATGDDDRVMAAVGLVEGDATTVMLLWALEHLTAEEMLAISQAPLPDTTGVPEWMVRQLEFPYLDATEFASRLYARGGFAAVDEAFADPPLTTEQVLHFSAYLDNDPPIEVAPVDPGLDGLEVARDSTFGEAMTAIWLAALGANQAEADRAAAGWGGDRVTAFMAADGEVAVVLRLAWDTKVDAEQFEETYLDISGGLAVAAAYERVDDTTIFIVQGSSQTLVDGLIGELAG